MSGRERPAARSCRTVTERTLAETLSAPDGRVAARVRSVTVRHDLTAGRSRPLTDAEKDRLAQT